MPVPLTAKEQTQTLQTIEMFEVVAQSDPSDYLALEILKESYFKLGRHQDVVRTSKRIAQAYVRSGQLSSAILEYESILQVLPNDPDVAKALAEIENQALQIGAPPAPLEPEPEPPPKAPPALKMAEPVEERKVPTEIDDGRAALHKLLVEGKQISETDFNLFWNTPRLDEPPKQVLEPFIQTLADKQLLPLEKSLKLISEKSRLSFLPLEKYDVDIELARSFPREVCQRWCILPFDRMSKSVLVATANPFNKQAALDLEETNEENSTKPRLLWYIASPTELMKILRKVFR